MKDEKTKQNKKQEETPSVDQGQGGQEEKVIRPKDFLKNYVKPHRKKSRPVIGSDLPTVVRDSHTLYNLCFTRQGDQAGACAVAHPQINDSEPLRFFVIADKQIIINPVITRHTKVMVDSEEGCTTFPQNKMIKVKRFNKIEVDYQTLDAEGKLTDVLHAKLDGKMAKIFQHEINHLDSIYLYD